MNNLIDSFSVNTQIRNVADELNRKDISVAELIALATSIEVLIIRNPKLKSSLEAKLAQIEKRILTTKSKAKQGSPKLAESILTLIQEQ